MTLSEIRQVRPMTSHVVIVELEGAVVDPTEVAGISSMKGDLTTRIHLRHGESLIAAEPFAQVVAAIFPRHPSSVDRETPPDPTPDEFFVDRAR